jgi:transcriptional antiterminator NusG
MVKKKPQGTEIKIVNKTLSKKKVKEIPKWYALKTASRTKKKLNERLEEAGITSYLPLFKEMKQWSDRKKMVEEPMFRGYIFVFTVSADFVKILELEGAVHFVKFGGKHATLDDEQIEFVRKVETNKLRFEVTQENFEEGDFVEVTQGALKGFKGEWIMKKSKYNIAVHIKQLERIITVELPLSYVKKIPKPETD